MPYIAIICAQLIPAANKERFGFNWGCEGFSNMASRTQLFPNSLGLVLVHPHIDMAHMCALNHRNMNTSNIVANHSYQFPI